MCGAKNLSQKADNLFMTVKEYREHWKYFKAMTIKRRKRINLIRSSPRHNLKCFCPTCLYYCYRWIRKNSKPSIPGFFYGWILLFHYKDREKDGHFIIDWGQVKSILESIPDLDRLLPLVLQKTGYMYLKKVEEAVEYKIRLIEYRNDLARKGVIMNVAKMLAIEKVLSEEKESVEKIQRLANEKKQIFLRDIQLKTGMKISDFHAIVMHYDGDIGLILDSGKRKDQLIFEPNPDAKISHPLDKFNQIIAEIKDAVGMVPVKPSTIK